MDGVCEYNPCNRHPRKVSENVWEFNNEKFRYVSKKKQTKPVEPKIRGEFKPNKSIRGVPLPIIQPASPTVQNSIKVAVSPNVPSPIKVSPVGSPSNGDISQHVNVIVREIDRCSAACVSNPGVDHVKDIAKLTALKTTLSELMSKITRNIEYIKRCDEAYKEILSCADSDDPKVEYENNGL
jgi:hypothetical protein